MRRMRPQQHAVEARRQMAYAIKVLGPLPNSRVDDPEDVVWFSGYPVKAKHLKAMSVSAMRLEDSMDVGARLRLQLHWDPNYAQL